MKSTYPKKKQYTKEEIAANPYRETATEYEGVTCNQKICKINGQETLEYIYKIHYYLDGKRIHETVGRWKRDGMTAKKASLIRGNKITRKEPPKAVVVAAKKAEAAKAKWTIDGLWELRKSDTSEKSIKGLAEDNSRYKNYIQPTFGHKTVEEIGQEDIDDFVSFLKKAQFTKTISKKDKKFESKPLSVSTQRSCLELIRRICNFGHKKGKSAEPKFFIKLPVVDNTRIDMLNIEQYKKLIEVCINAKKVVAGHFVLMLIFTGCRKSELFKMKWTDLNFNFEKNSNIYEIREPKSGKLKESIPLNSRAIDVLLYMAYYNAYHKNPHISGSEYVFAGRGGKQRTEIKRGVVKINKDAGIPSHFRLMHSYRHVYASMLASYGNVTLEELRMLLTHKDIKTTMRYAHLLPDAHKRIIDNVDKTLDSILEPSV